MGLQEPRVTVSPTHLKLGQDIYISAEILSTWLTDRQIYAQDKAIEPTEYEEVSAYWRGRKDAFANTKDYIAEVSGTDYD
jgi:hypothetical protein